MLSIIALAVLMLNCAQPSTTAEPTDACTRTIPKSLRDSLKASYPHALLPRVTDNLAEDVEAEKQQGRSGCLGVATEDFNGDGASDFAVLLAPQRRGNTLVVVALRSGEQWTLALIREWDSARNRLYVGTAAPGKYERSEAFSDPPSEPGELQRIESTKSGIITGRTEASGIYYFLTDQGWKHVWAID